MERVLGRFSPQLYALMRIVVGLLFACHGAQKLFGLLGGHQMPLASQMGLAGIIEFGGGLLIAIGFLTGTRRVHRERRNGGRLLQGALPAGASTDSNGGELAVLYCFVFLYIASRGAGIWAVDRSGIS